MSALYMGVTFMETIRTVELFAGVGGFRLGLGSASDRFEVIWANQWEPSMREQYAFECYTTHFGNKKHHVCQDIAKAKIDVPDHDRSRQDLCAKLFAGSG